MVSIRAPREGRDLSGVNIIWADLTVSIRAPREGRDC